MLLIHEARFTGSPQWENAGALGVKPHQPVMEKSMLKTFLRISILAGFLIMLEHPAAAQEIVHALTGTVSAIDPSQKTITVFQDGSSKTTFRVMSSSKARISFNKTIRDESASAEQFKKNGAYVILFYFGMDQNRTAVALKNLGQGPFFSTKGTRDQLGRP